MKAAGARKMGVPGREIVFISLRIDGASFSDEGEGRKRARRKQNPRISSRKILQRKPREGPGPGGKKRTPLPP